MENFKIDVDSDGIALITFDVPGRSMNTITGSVMRDLITLVETLKSDEKIKGAVITSGKTTGFCAGAEVFPGRKSEWFTIDDTETPSGSLTKSGSLSRRSWSQLGLLLPQIVRPWVSLLTSVITVAVAAKVEPLTTARNIADATRRGNVFFIEITLV